MFNVRLPYSELSILPWERTGSLEQVDVVLPSVSIVIPIYNSGRFLEKTIRSLLCNDLSSVELILMDGGSSDATMQIVEHYKDIFTVIHSAPDEGQSDAINKGFEKATGDILYWLNGDDVILPNTLNKVRQHYLNHSSCDVLVGNAFMTELNFTPINHFVFSAQKLEFKYLLDYAKNHLIQPSVFFSRNAWEDAGPLDIHDHYAMDADLFIGMARSYKLQHIDLDIAYSVYHEGCKTRGARAESITALALVQAKHNGLTEAAETLKILVDLYRQLKTASEQSPGSSAKIKVLEARLFALETHSEKQTELLLDIDLEQHA